MTQLLLEIYSEEIPARMQKQAQIRFVEIFASQMKHLNLKFKQPPIAMISATYMIIQVEDIDLITEVKTAALRGPKSSLPKDSPAVRGFLLKNNSELLEERDGYYFTPMHFAKQETATILSKNIPLILSEFAKYWPKSMKWNETGQYWARPIRAITAIFNGQALDFSFAGVTSSHDSIVENERQIADRRIVLDSEARRQMVIDELTAEATKLDLRLLDEDLIEGHLIDEVIGLVDYPTVMIGKIDQKFMTMPAEVLIATLRNNQRFFCLQTYDGSLAPYFAVVSNNPNPAAKTTIIAGAERVVKTRLSDAQFFLEIDKKRSLASRIDDLKSIIFQKNLGTLYQKMERVRHLARFFAKLLGSNEIYAMRAAELARTDLTTELVRELPELQGIIGSYYAKLDGETREVVLAISEQYLPTGADSKIPTTSIGVALALADKVDTITGMFLAGQRPTSSRDPFAVRRAALGVIRIIIDNKITIGLDEIFIKSVGLYGEMNWSVMQEILSFIRDRFTIYLDNSDFAKAALASSPNDINGCYLRWQTIGQMNSSGELATLIELYNRVNGPLCDSVPPLNISLLTESEELALWSQILELRNSYNHSNKIPEIAAALTSLKPAITAFFKQIRIDVADAQIKRNRLALLSEVRNLFHEVAHFNLL